MHLPFEQPSPLVRIYTKETLAKVGKDVCTRLLIATLFILTKNWKQPKCLSIGDFLSELWSLSLLKNTIDDQAAIKKNERYFNILLWHDLQSILLNILFYLRKWRLFDYIYLFITYF